MIQRDRLSDADVAGNIKQVTTPVDAPERLMFYYDRRFSQLRIEALCKHVEKPESAFLFNLTGLLKALDLKPEELKAMLAELEDGSYRPTTSNTEQICMAGIPTDLTGKTVLDIGGYDGRFAKICLDRGAKEAYCLDSDQWQLYGWAKPETHPGVTYVKGDLYDWHKPVDFVLCFNVIYHVEDPHEALRCMRAYTREQMLLCTLYIWNSVPVWRVFEPGEVNADDVTVRWGPSIKGLYKSLRICGWSHAEEVDRAQERIVLRCVP